MTILFTKGINAANSRLSGGVTTIAQDDFDRSNASLDGATMSDGSSTWEGAPSQGAGFAVVSNQAKCEDGSIAVQVCDSMADTANIQVSGTFIASGTLVGVVARQTASGAYYYLCSEGGTLRLYSRTGAGAGSKSQVGSDGSALSANDVIKLKCEGTTLTGYLNGAVDIGPATDSDHSTGKAGIVGANTAAIIDEFLAETV